jgi:hypothetical protein
MAAQDEPTVAQLRYLRVLAEERGQTFTTPRTRAEASREIQRLKRSPASTRRERAIERAEAERHVQREHFDATAVQPSEIEGYGSDATWRGQR